MNALVRTTNAQLRWAASLQRYQHELGTADALRHQPMTIRPWPAPNNPMLGYLMDETLEIAEHHTLAAAIVWLAEHAWCEGAIAEHAALTRGRSLA